MLQLSPNPGNLPSRPAPRPGQQILLKMGGYPPYKNSHFSIRNPKHRDYQRFVLLREAATGAMRGRKWYDGPVGLELVVYAPATVLPLLAYAGGVMDTLDGSHGVYFTYLPIVYQDDCQVCLGDLRFIKDSSPHYTIRITFLSQQRGKPRTNGRRRPGLHIRITSLSRQTGKGVETP